MDIELTEPELIVPEIRNPVYTDTGLIDCEIEHVKYGWVPTTLAPPAPTESPIILAIWDAVQGMEISPYVAPEPVTLPDNARILNRKSFEFLLALTGFGEIWDGLEVAMKAVDVQQYAAIKAERKGQRFHLDRTLALVAMFRPMATNIAPDVDLSDDAIRAAWDVAENYKGLG